jgi:hypothetical protein
VVLERAGDPLATFEDLVGNTRPHFASPTVHRASFDPSLAEPLADLLDALADMAVTTLAERSAHGGMAMSGGMWPKACSVALRINPPRPRAFAAAVDTLKLR